MDQSHYFEFPLLKCVADEIRTGGIDFRKTRSGVKKESKSLLIIASGGRWRKMSKLKGGAEEVEAEVEDKNWRRKK